MKPKSSLSLSDTHRLSANEPVDVVRGAVIRRGNMAKTRSSLIDFLIGSPRFRNCSQRGLRSEEPACEDPSLNLHAAGRQGFLDLGIGQVLG